RGVTFDVVTNDMFQLWRALITIINFCLTGKTSGFERPTAPVLHILWGVINRAHINYAERIWEEFTQSIHTFIKDKKNLTHHTQGKKKAIVIVISSVRFTKLLIYYLQSKHKFHPRPDSLLHLPYEEHVLGYLKFSAKGTKREVFGMPISNKLITTDIPEEQYYKEYMEKVAKHQRYLVGEEGSDPNSLVPKPAKATKKSKPSAPKAAPTREKKRKLVTETSDKSSPAKSLKLGLVTKRRKPTRSLSLVDEFVDEEADTQRVEKESLKSIHDAPRDSEMESDEEVLGIDVGVQDEGRAGPNPDEQDEGQAGPNPGDAAASQPPSSHVVHAGPNLEHMDLEATYVLTQQNPDNG
nr:E-beta-farnesene synthase [Tanacetum cinerariifolium]